MTPNKKYLYSFEKEKNHSASKILSLIDDGLDVLEVGCASGVQTKHMKEVLSCSVTGIEIDPAAAEDSRPYCKKMIVGNVENINLQENLGSSKFDVITFADVLEHLYDPTDVLRKVRPFLRENGRILASIPNITHAAICWELAHGRFDYQKFGLLDNTHIRFFSRKNVARMFNDTGYGIKSWDRVTKGPKDTEFTVHCRSEHDDKFLSWIQMRNPEATTYQFIVSAIPRRTDATDPEFLTLENQDKIEELENRITELNRQNSALISQIQWLESHRFGPISSLLNRLLR